MQSFGARGTARGIDFAGAATATYGFELLCGGIWLARHKPSSSILLKRGSTLLGHTGNTLFSSKTTIIRAYESTGVFKPISNSVRLTQVNRCKTSSAKVTSSFYSLIKSTTSSPVKSNKRIEVLSSHYETQGFRSGSQNEHISHILNNEGTHGQWYWGVYKVHPSYLDLQRPTGSMKPSEPPVLYHLSLLNQRLLRSFIDFTHRLERHGQKYQEAHGAIKVYQPNESIHFDDSIDAANDTEQEKNLEKSHCNLDHLICPFLQHLQTSVSFGSISSALPFALCPTTRTCVGSIHYVTWSFHGLTHPKLLTVTRVENTIPNREAPKNSRFDHHVIMV